MTINHMLIIGATLLSCFSAQAQQGINVNQAKKAFQDDSSRSVYEVKIPYASSKEAIDELGKVLEKGTRSKVSVNGGDINIDHVVFKHRWSDSVNVKAMLRAEGSGVIIDFAVDQDSVEVGPVSTPEMHERVTDILNDYAQEVYTSAVKERVKLEEKTLSDIEKDLKSARKEYNKIRDDISEERIELQQIKEREEKINIERTEVSGEIQTNKSYYKSISKEYASQKSTAKDQYKESKKKLKDLKKESKKLRKDRFKLEDDLQELKLKLKKSEEFQKIIRDRIAAQSAVVNQWKSKLIY